MALIEAEIIDAFRDGGAVVTVVVYRSDGIEISKETFRFNALNISGIQKVQDAIIEKGHQIKGLIESDIEIKKLVGTKISITDEAPVIASQKI